MHVATAELRQEHCIRRFRHIRQDGPQHRQGNYSLFTMVALVLKLAASGTTHSLQRQECIPEDLASTVLGNRDHKPRTQSRFARFEEPDSCVVFAEENCNILSLEQPQVEVLHCTERKQCEMMEAQRSCLIAACATRYRAEASGVSSGADHPLSGHEALLLLNAAQCSHVTK